MFKAIQGGVVQGNSGQVRVVQELSGYFGPLGMGTFLVTSRSHKVSVTLILCVRLSLSLR